MPTLGNIIRIIRQRLKQTMSAFADLIGTDQSTISRYESGQVIPSRTVLILLFLLAREDERRPILEAMGGIDEELLKSQFASSQETLKILLADQRSKRRSSAQHQTLVQFAQEAAAIVSLGEPIEPALIEILKLCREHGSNRKLLNTLAQMLPYFEFVASQPRGNH